MSLFYDPHDAEDQQRIESILNKNNIPYSLHPEPVTGKGPMLIFVSEKNFKRAEDLIVPHGNKVEKAKQHARL